MRRVVAVLGLLIALVATLAGCGGPDYRAMNRGECLPEKAQVVGQREADPPTVDCDQPHRYEVYGTAELDGARQFPGQDAVDADARQKCYELFEPSVGYGADEMPDDTKVVYLDPSESSWNDQADRDVECLLVSDDDKEGRVIRDRPATTTTTTDVGQEDEA